MASDNEASCVSDPNFAVICSFLKCFGKSCGINYPDIAKLQEMLEDAHEVPPQLVELHVKLLRKLRKTVTPEKWERSLVKFCHTYSNQDGWELERFGYKKARIGVKLRLLKVLLEAQFDLNPRFKLEVNKLAADELRVEPLGRDKTGLAYWFQLDEECNMRVYREDLDEENWELVARDREGVVNLINSLSDGEAGPIPINDDSSNSLEISEKPIIDTGQVDELTSPEEDTKLENAIITNDTVKSVNEVSKITNEKISDTAKVENGDLVKNVAVDENVDEEGEEEEDEDEDDEEGDEEEEEEEDEEEVSNEDSSKANSDEEDDDDDEDDDDEEDDEDSQEAKATQNQKLPTLTPSKIIENKVPPMTIQAKHNIIERQQRAPWKTSQIPVATNFPQTMKFTAMRPNVVEPTHVKSIETPVITTSPLKLVNIQDLQNPVDDRLHARDEKYTIKSALAFQSSDSSAIHTRNPIKPIDKLAANLSRIQSEKLEKPGAAKLLEKIAENLARSSVAQGNLANGDDDKVQEFLTRTALEKSTITIVPARNQRGMDLSTSPRGWETTSDHARPMDYSGIDLSSRKVTKSTDLHSSAYRSQDFQHREMDLSTRKIVKTDMSSMPYDSRTVILRNHGNTTMVTDLSKKQIPYSGYDLAQPAAYHSGTRITGKDDSHRLPNYTILPDPSKIASMRMSAGGALKRPLEHVDDSQQEILKRMRQEGITLRGPIDKRTAAAPMMASHRRDEIVGAAIEEPVMMIQGEGSGSDCDAVNPIIGDAIEEPIIFFYGTGAGRDCDTGNPGDETSSDKKESNESKKEGCSDVTTSLTTTKILPTDESSNETSSNDDKSSHRIITNYSQSTADIGPTSDNCQSTVVSSVSPKGKFKPTLGIQVIARTSGNLAKKSSRWDVGRPEDKAECDSSILTSDQHISTVDESIINTREYENTNIERLASNDDCVVEGKNESDDITSTSNQTFGSSKIAECTSSYDVVEADQIPSIQPDSSFINETTSVNDCESRGNKILHIEQCDSSVTTAIPSSSLDQGESVESTIKEKSNLDDVETCISSKSERDEKTGSTNDSPPRFFFGPNCVSYSSKGDEARLAQVAGTSFMTPENAEVAKNNNNFVKTADVDCSESSSESYESNVEARLKNVEITEEKEQLDCPDDIAQPVESSIRSECRVQSSTSPGPKDEADCLATPEPMNVPISREEKNGRINESVTQSANVIQPTESSETEISKRSESGTSKLNIEAPEMIESSTDHEIKVESAKIPDAETSSSISVVKNAIDVDTIEKNVEKDDEIPTKVVPLMEIDDEVVPPMEINSEVVTSMEPNAEVVHSMDTNAEVVPSIGITETEESGSNNRGSDSNDHIRETTYEEAASSALQVTPDDSSQTIETNDDEKQYENKELELSSDLDEKTKQSMESEDDSMANSVEKISEDKNTNNELCNEDAQDGFSKSSEIIEETKDETVESSSNIIETRRSEHINEERSEMSVELPDDSSGDSVAPSSSSLAVNPSGEDTTISEICETSSIVENSERSLEDKVTPAPIVDANISKSPERITIESEKASSSGRLLDSMDAYTDDLSENQSSADQDSNEAMVIDDGASDSNESTTDTSGMKETTSDVKALNFKDKVLEIKSIIEKSVKRIKTVRSVETSEVVSRETMFVAPLENVEEPEEGKNQSCKNEDQKTLVDSKMDEISDLKDEEKISLEIGETTTGNLPETAKLKDTKSTVTDADEKFATVPQSSLVPNYDCSDEDEVSDDVFEMGAAEIEDLMEQIDAEEMTTQTDDKIVGLPEVPEAKISEVSDVKIDEKKDSIELEDTTTEEKTRDPCENDKEFSEHEEVADKSQVDLEVFRKSTEAEEKLVVDEELEIPTKRIESEEKEVESEEKEVETEEKKIESKESDRLKAIDDLADGANEIAEKSRDLTTEIMSTSATRDVVDVPEKTREIAVGEVLTNDSAILSKVSNAIDENRKEVERANEFQKVSQKDPSTEEESGEREEKVEETSISQSVIENYDNEGKIQKIKDASEKIEKDRPFGSQDPKPETSIVDSMSDQIHTRLETSDKNENIEESKSLLPVQEKEDKTVFSEKQKIPVLSVEQEVPVLSVEQKVPVFSVEQKVPGFSFASKMPEKISIKNALQDHENSPQNDERMTTLKTSSNIESNLSNENPISTSQKPNETLTLSNAPTAICEEITDVLSLKNESKKEASKRLHGVTDTDDFPPTKSRPPNVDFAKDHTENRGNEEKTSRDDKKIIASVSAPSQVVTAFSSIVSPNEKIPSAISQPEMDLTEKLKNHEVPEIRENYAKSAIQVERPIEQRSSEIQSVDIKCIDLESDDSMGIDNESMFDTPADDVDPLACTEVDLTKPTSLEESSVPKIGIRVKPVADLVYEGWKLDSPEPPAVPVAPTVSRKRRNSAHESNSEDTTIKIDDDVGETGGKRMKLRGKRSPDMKLRKSVEASRPESVSSEDEASKAQTTIETIEIKDNDEEEVVDIATVRNERKPRGRPKGRRRRGNRSFPRAATRAKVTENKTANPTVEAPAVVPVPTSTETGQPESKKKRKKRKMVLGLEIGIDIAVPDSQGGTGTDEIPVRQSRRIAQLKIKEEADKRRIEEETMSDPKDKKDRDGTEKKKRKKQKPSSEDEPVVVVKEVEREVKSRKQRKKKKMSSTFNEAKPWQSSSGSSSDEEGPEEEEDEEIESEGSLLFKSDHEFSPESDLEKDDESEPLRRARTAQKAQSDVEDAEDEYACQKCGKVDHPEWILLCDTCDKGWHCSCLRPALMLIPEGDWFCPPCQHTILVNKLRESLKTFDQNSKKHENEVLRKKRLAFVGISLDNVLHKSEQADSSRGSSRGSDDDSSSSSSESSSSTSSSEESEPVYQLRERRCANTYKFNEYDDMINAAIQDEVDAVQGAGNQGRGKDIATIVNAEKEEAQSEALKGKHLNQDDDDDEDGKKSGKESDEDYKVDKDDADEDEEDQRQKPSGKKMLSRKKHRKLNSLDISSEDDPDSDEDFKGSSSDEEDDFDEQLDSSDDSFARSKRRGRKGEARPVRRSTRAARTRYDADFIDDDSDDSDRPKRKKSRSVWEGSESEESDNSWRQRKKKSKTVPTPRFRTMSKTKPRKKKKRKRIIVDSDNASDDNEETVEAKNEDEPEDAEAEQQAEPNAKDAENAEYDKTTGENHEEEMQDKETNCETSQVEVEHQKKKKKESTPKQKKAPGIRRKIVYGGLDDDGPRQEEETLARRTRGRKINYQDIMGSDSEEELKKVLRKTEESEEEFVVNEGEEFNEDAEKDSDSGDIYSPKKELPKGKAKSPKKIKKSPGSRKSLIDNGTPKQRKKPGPKPGSKNKPKDQPALSISPIVKPNDTDSISRGMDMEGSTMSATGSVIGEVPEGSLTGLTPDDINALDDDQLEQMMMEDEEYGRRQLELAAIEIARNKKQEEREAKKLEKARLKALEILAAEQQRNPNALEGTDGELPKKKKRGRRSKAEILAEQMRRDGVPSLIAGNLLPTAAAAVAAVATSVHTDVTTPMVSPNIVVTTPTLPTVVAAPTIIPVAAAAAAAAAASAAAAAGAAVAAVAVETERSPDVGQLPLMMAGPDGHLFSPDGSPMKPKRRGRGKGKKTLALEAARAAEAAAKTAVGADIGQLGITGTESNPDVKHDDIPNVLPTPGSSTSGSAPPTPPATSLVTSQGLPPVQSPNQQQQQQHQQQHQQQQSVYPSLPPGQQSSVITRMLQSQPVSSTPQSFTAAAAAMGHKYFGGPNAAGQMMPGPRPGNYDMPTRGRIPSPYRQPVPSPMPPHFAAVRSGTPPMRMRVPGSQLYHTPHHPMDPSPSGGGPISINSRDRSSPLGPGPAMIPPAAGSPLAKGGPTPPPPPPPYVRGGPTAHSRFADNPQIPPRHQIPQFPTSSPANHAMQQPSPPPNRPSGNFSPYHPPPPPNYHYGAYPPPPPMTTADDAAAYQGSPYSAEHFSTPAESQPQIQPPPPPQPPQSQPQSGPTSQQQQHPNEPGQANKQYDEEGTGEFGGLVSYFSSQREDDLDS